jgi:hypothetical protein
MSISSISTDYTGRKADLSLFPQQKVPLVLAPLEFSASPKSIAGILKGSQNYLRVLLTPRGCYKSDPTFGTQLVQQIRSGSLKYPGDVLHLFAMESGKAESWIRQRESSSDPADERIGTVVLESFDLDRTRLKMDLTYTSASGENISLLVPVQLNL